MFRSFFLKIRHYSDEVVEKIKTHFVFSNFFFRKSYKLWDNVEKYCRVGQVTDDNIAHAHFMLEN